MDYNLQKEISIGNVQTLEVLKDYFECLVCDCKISGEDQAVSHVLGSKHLRKIKLQENEHRKIANLNTQLDNKPQKPSSTPIPAPRYSIQAQEKPEKLNNPRNIEHDDIKPNESNEYYCQLCKIRVNGSTPWLDHVSGKGHLRKEHLAKNPLDDGVSSSGINSSLSSLHSSNYPGAMSHDIVSSSSGPDLPLEYDRSTTTKNITGTSGTKRHCPTCDIDVTGDAPYKQHCEGKQHLKNLLLKGKERSDATSHSSSVYNENAQDVSSRPTIVQRSDIPVNENRRLSNSQQYSGRNTFTTIEADERIPILFP